MSQTAAMTAPPRAPRAGTFGMAPTHPYRPPPGHAGGAVARSGVTDACAPTPRHGLPVGAVTRAGLIRTDFASRLHNGGARDDAPTVTSFPSFTTISERPI